MVIGVDEQRYDADVYVAQGREDGADRYAESPDVELGWWRYPILEVGTLLSYKFNPIFSYSFCHESTPLINEAHSCGPQEQLV